MPMQRQDDIVEGKNSNWHLWKSSDPIPHSLLDLIGASVNTFLIWPISFTAHWTFLPSDKLRKSVTPAQMVQTQWVQVFVAVIQALTLCLVVFIVCDRFRYFFVYFIHTGEEILARGSRIGNFIIVLRSLFRLDTHDIGMQKMEETES